MSVNIVHSKMNFFEKKSDFFEGSVCKWLVDRRFLTPGVFAKARRLGQKLLLLLGGSDWANRANWRGVECGCRVSSLKLDAWDKNYCFCLVGLIGLIGEAGMWLPGVFAKARRLG